MYLTNSTITLNHHLTLPICLCTNAFNLPPDGVLLYTKLTSSHCFMCGSLTVRTMETHWNWKLQTSTSISEFISTFTELLKLFTLLFLILYSPATHYNVGFPEPCKFTRTMTPLSLCRSLQQPGRTSNRGWKSMKHFPATYATFYATHWHTNRGAGWGTYVGLPVCGGAIDQVQAMETNTSYWENSYLQLWHYRYI